MYKPVFEKLKQKLRENGILETLNIENHYEMFLNSLKFIEVNMKELVPCKDYSFYYVKRGKIEMQITKMVYMKKEKKGKRGSVKTSTKQNDETINLDNMFIESMDSEIKNIEERECFLFMNSIKKNFKKKSGRKEKKLTPFEIFLNNQKEAKREKSKIENTVLKTNILLKCAKFEKNKKVKRTALKNKIFKFKIFSREIGKRLMTEKKMDKKKKEKNVKNQKKNNPLLNLKNKSKKKKFPTNSIFSIKPKKKKEKSFDLISNAITGIGKEEKKEKKTMEERFLENKVISKIKAMKNIRKRLPSIQEESSRKSIMGEKKIMFPILIAIELKRFFSLVQEFKEHDQDQINYSKQLTEYFRFFDTSMGNFHTELRKKLIPLNCSFNQVIFANKTVLRYLVIVHQGCLNLNVKARYRDLRPKKFNFKILTDVKENRFISLKVSLFTLLLRLLNGEKEIIFVQKCWKILKNTKLCQNPVNLLFFF